MRAGQTLVADDGYEVMLFPIDIMNISQGENGSTSHQGTYNIDLVGTTTHYPYYAPCTCTLVNSWGGTNNGMIWESNNKVHCADGTLRKVHFIFMHNDESRPAFGTVRRQGELIGNTGTKGEAYGDHVHMCFGSGSYNGMTQRHSDPDQWDLTNRLHIYDVCYKNDTTIVRDYGYNWRKYSGGVLNPNKHRFKWVLYAKKLRNRNFN